MAQLMKPAFRLGRIAALIAGMVLLLQAIAVPPARAEVIEVCTAHGIERVLAPGDAGPAMPGDCGHCGQCVLAAPAALPVSQVSIPVRYASPVSVLRSAQQTAAVATHPPPRPPGQGPPSL